MRLTNTASQAGPSSARAMRSDHAMRKVFCGHQRHEGREHKNRNISNVWSVLAHDIVQFYARLKKRWGHRLPIDDGLVK